MIVQPDSKKYWLIPGDEETDGAELDSNAKDVVDYLETKDNGK